MHLQFLLRVWQRISPCRTLWWTLVLLYLPFLERLLNELALMSFGVDLATRTLSIWLFASQTSYFFLNRSCSCRHTTKQGSYFCRMCGYPSLRRIPVTLHEDGQLEFHFSRKFQKNLRGTKVYDNKSVLNIYESLRLLHLSCKVGIFSPVWLILFDFSQFIFDRFITCLTPFFSVFLHSKSGIFYDVTPPF